MKMKTHPLWLKITVVVKAPEKIGENFVSWFSNNQMKLNIDKDRLLLYSQEPH